MLFYVIRQVIYFDFSCDMLKIFEIFRFIFKLEYNYFLLQNAMNTGLNKALFQRFGTSSHTLHFTAIWSWTSVYYEQWWWVLFVFIVIKRLHGIYLDLTYNYQYTFHIEHFLINRTLVHDNRFSYFTNRALNGNVIYTYALINYHFFIDYFY